MTLAHKTVPDPQAILRVWRPFKDVVGVTSIHSEEDYTQARATIEVLLDEIGDNENHPLADVLDYLADQVATYEEVYTPIQESEPKAVLRFLMDQHGLKQEDLADCAWSRMSRRCCRDRWTWDFDNVKSLEEVAAPRHAR